MLESLDGHATSLDSVGGKARSLARMAAVGLPVPPGVVLTTNAYAEFVHANEFQGLLDQYSVPQICGRAVSFAHAEQQISKLFKHASLPRTVINWLDEARQVLGYETPLAVRSSATTEDLEHTSFAGQHRTDLNVIGPDALNRAVLSCWMSLWSSNAMAYRYHVGIAPADLAMAVVIQALIPSEVSGIAFTANPATGSRSKILVNSSLGLGEAIVSGEVDPDLFEVDRTTRKVVSSQIHSKETMSIARSQGGIASVEIDPNRQEEASLSIQSLGELTDLAIRVEQVFDNQPQDIEWAMANNDIYLIQSRPITNLPPVPIENVKWEAPAENALILRHQLVEHIAGPVSTLFEETYLKVGLQEAWGRNLAKNYPKTYKFEHSQPPWCFVVHPTVNGYAYKRVGTPKVPPGMESPKPTRNPLVRRLLIWRATLSTRKRWIRRWKNQALPEYLEVKRRWEELDATELESTQLLDGIWALARCEADHWFNGIYFGVALNRNHEIRLNQFFEKYAKAAGFVSSQLLSGFDSLALNAQRELFEIARTIRSTEQLFHAVLRGGPTRVKETLQRHASAAILQRLHDYLQTYGKQAFTLDFVEPAPIEDPTPIYRNLFALVIDAEYDFDAQRRKLMQRRDVAVTRTNSYFSPFRRMEFHRRLKRIQRDYHLREEALSLLGQAWPALRRLALELGSRLVENEILSVPDDIFFLTTNEISLAIGSVSPQYDEISRLRERAMGRRLQREAQKFLNPPLRIGHDPNFPKPAERRDDDSALLKGSAVSPGIVDATACVILETRDFGNMQPGAVLVCPATNPAWTSLFPQAAALVTDIGGLLAHGSIIAREFGIPAVLGIGDATRKIRTGDRLTVDGNAGTVRIHDR